jgi:hypothetical protein
VTKATILPRTCRSARRPSARGIDSKVICSVTVGLIFPSRTSVISSVAMRAKSSCRRRGHRHRKLEYVLEEGYRWGVADRAMKYHAVHPFVFNTLSDWEIGVCNEEVLNVLLRSLYRYSTTKSLANKRCGTNSTG